MTLLLGHYYWDIITATLLLGHCYEGIVIAVTMSSNNVSVTMCQEQLLDIVAAVTMSQ